MRVPCPCSQVECDGLSHLFWLGPKDPQTCQDMVGGIHDEVAHLDIKVDLKIELQAELYKGLKNPQVVPCKPVLPCPQVENSLSSCQPPVEVTE